MGFFSRFRRGVRKSITSLSVHSASTSSTSPPSSPQTCHAAVSEQTPAPSVPNSPVSPRKPLPKMLSWGSPDRPTTSASSTHAFAAKSTLFPKKKSHTAPTEDSRIQCRREYQEVLGRFTMTFGTRRPSQLVPDYNENGDSGGGGIGGISPRTSCRGSFDEDYLRRADLEQH